MKKLICIALSALLALTAAACGAKPAAPSAPAPEPAAEWSRTGYYQNDDGGLLSVTWMDDIAWGDEASTSGWYVGALLGEDWEADAWGGLLPQEGNTLHGTLLSAGGTDPEAKLTVTVAEEGEDGLMLAVEGGNTYHFAPLDLPDANIFVTLSTEGWGNVEYIEGESTPEIDEEYPYQSAQINLAEPTTYTLLAWPNAGSVFVKWLKDGEDFSTEPQITVLLDETAEFVAVFEDDPDWQNPVMNFIGEYQCDRAHATVEAFGTEEAWITIEWAGSASEIARWDIFGKLDTDTLTIDYTDCTKSILTYDAGGEIVSQEETYSEATGTITFHYEDNTFTWHEDQSESGEDLLFEWVPVEGAVG